MGLGEKFKWEKVQMNQNLCSYCFSLKIKKLKYFSFKEKGLNETEIMLHSNFFPDPGLWQLKQLLSGGIIIGKENHHHTITPLFH